MSYSDLTEEEQHVWDEYATQRQITDWAGFTDAQENRKQAARDWLVARRKTLWHYLNDEPVDKKSNEANNRQARYNQLSDNNLNNSTPKHEYTLPASGCVDSEKSYIEEREGYLMIGGDGKSANPDQTDRKTANSDWLVSRRKQVWHLMNDEPVDEQANKDNQRQTRYDNLCIATHYGSAWDSYEKSHNKYGQTEHPDEPSNARSKCVSNCRKYLGVNEDPPNSNRGPQIDKWNDRVAGYLGAPWCASFATSMAWDSGAKGGSSAAVQYIVNMAKAGQGMFRGYTTNPGNVLRGDFAIVSCSSCHVGVCVDNDDAYHTIEGNTSPGSEGSQYDGGCVAERHRGKGEIIGWALVDYPG